MIIDIDTTNLYRDNLGRRVALFPCPWVENAYIGCPFETVTFGKVEQRFHAEPMRYNQNGRSLSRKTWLTGPYKKEVE